MINHVCEFNIFYVMWSVDGKGLHHFEQVQGSKLDPSMLIPIRKDTIKWPFNCVLPKGFLFLLLQSIGHLIVSFLRGIIFLFITFFCYKFLQKKNFCIFHYFLVLTFLFLFSSDQGVVHNQPFYTSNPKGVWKLSCCKCHHLFNK